MEKEFNLNVTPNGQDIVVRHGEAPKVFVYDGFKYLVHCAESFVELVKAKCPSKNCIVSYSGAKISALADDTVIARKQDYIDYSFITSDQFNEFKAVLDKPLNQKQFIDFLKRREPGDISDIESLLVAIQKFKYVLNISGDLAYDDNDNYTFAIKIGDAEGTVKLPQYVMANIEVFNEAKFFQFMELELKVIKPRSESEKLMFMLECPKLSRYLRSAMLREVEVVKKGLEGYLIVAGQWV